MALEKRGSLGCPVESSLGLQIDGRDLALLTTLQVEAEPLALYEISEP